MSDKFLEVVRRMPLTWTCIRCGGIWPTAPGDGQTMPAGFETETKSNGQRHIKGEICAECMEA